MSTSRPESAHHLDPGRVLAKHLTNIHRRVRRLELRPLPAATGGGGSPTRFRVDGQTGQTIIHDTLTFLDSYDTVVLDDGSHFEHNASVGGGVYMDLYHAVEPGWYWLKVGVSWLPALTSVDEYGELSIYKFDSSFSLLDVIAARVVTPRPGGGSGAPQVLDASGFLDSDGSHLFAAAMTIGPSTRSINGPGSQARFEGFLVQ